MTAPKPAVEAVQTPDEVAFEHAQRIAHERFLPIQAQIRAEHAPTAPTSAKGSNLPEAERLARMRAAMEAELAVVSRVAHMETRIACRPDLVARITAAADADAEAHVAALYPAPGDAATLAPERVGTA